MHRGVSLRLRSRCLSTESLLHPLLHRGAISMVGRASFAAVVIQVGGTVLGDRVSEPALPPAHFFARFRGWRQDVRYRRHTGTGHLWGGVRAWRGGREGTAAMAVARFVGVGVGQYNNGHPRLEHAVPDVEAPAPGTRSAVSQARSRAAAGTHWPYGATSPTASRWRTRSPRSRRRSGRSICWSTTRSSSAPWARWRRPTPTGGGRRWRSTCAGRCTARGRSCRACSPGAAAALSTSPAASASRRSRCCRPMW